MRPIERTSRAPTTSPGNDSSANGTVVFPRNGARRSREPRARIDPQRKETASQITWRTGNLNHDFAPTARSCPRVSPSMYNGLTLAGVCPMSDRSFAGDVWGRLQDAPGGSERPAQEAPQGNRGEGT